MNRSHFHSSFAFRFVIHFAMFAAMAPSDLRVMAECLKEEGLRFASFTCRRWSNALHTAALHKRRLLGILWLGSMMFKRFYRPWVVLRIQTQCMKGKVAWSANGAAYRPNVPYLVPADQSPESTSIFGFISPPADLTNEIMDD